MVVDERSPIEGLVFEIKPSIQAELRKYPGKWAALTPSTIIAISDTSTGAYEAARAAGIETPVIYPIPDTRSGYSYY